jgi:DNA-binding NarL/FixJ family response regulator
MDHGSISRMMREHFAAEVTPADSGLEALDLARSEKFDLVLINRLLDADGSPGLEVLSAIKSDETLRHLPVMLVSNYDDAQREAMELGALRGFGKSTLGQAQTLARLRAVLEPEKGE